jgi:integrase
MKLTDAKCRAAKSAAKDYKLADGFGLYLLVKKNGSKLWKWKYYFNGLERKLSLGSYPSVGVKQARQLLLEQRALLESGLDPSYERKMKRLQVQLSAETTFRAVGNEYIQKMEKEGRATATLIKACWMLDILSAKLGNRPIAEIKPLEVLQVLKALENKGQLETARKVRALASRIFRYAIATERAEYDPCPALRGAIATPQVKSHAALLEADEIGGLMRAIRTYGGDPIVRLALEFSAHVFQRPGEVRQANWSEIDFEKAVWIIPAERMKMRLPHRVPLSPQAISILRELHDMTGNGKFVFPSLRSAKRPMSENAVNAALRRMGYTSDEMTAHGFRAMASTQLNESGLFSEDAIERALAHKDKNHIRGIYDRGMRWEERVKLHDWWSEKLQRLEAEPVQKLAA